MLISICSLQNYNKLLHEMCLCLKLGLLKEGKVEVEKVVGQSSLTVAMVCD